MTQSEESTPVSQAKIRALVTCLGQRNGLDFSSVEIAETLWLATKIKPADSFFPSPPPALDLPELLPEVPLPPPPTQPLPEDASNPAAQSLDPAAQADLATSVPKAEALSPQTLPVWLADPAMLTNPLAIIRALKPLLQKVDVGLSNRLDEEATVDTIARTQVYLPVLEPVQEPWFDVIVVVDQGSSMQIWQRLVKDLVHMLKWYGIFRNVQVFDLDIQPAEKDRVLLRSRSRRVHYPNELIDQNGQRIAIVLSDCAGPYWWDGTLMPMLKSWGQAMPMVVWQMLPEWMWARTALGRGAAAALTNRKPGAANLDLKVRVLGRRERKQINRNDALNKAKLIPAPVVTSDIRNLRNWSLMLSGDRRETTPGFILPAGSSDHKIPKAKPIEVIAAERVDQRLRTDQDRTPAEREQLVAQEIEAIARERVQQFRKQASPKARRLVMLLAAAPVITLPVVRLIRDSMMYDDSPLPVAEVFLSGLLQRLGNHDEDNWDWVQYDFVPKVRDILLALLPTVDTVDVVNSVSAAVERRWNQLQPGQSFRAFLLDPKVKAPSGLEGLRSFASVTAEILEPLGGPYTEFARQLRRGLGEEQERETDEFPDLPLEDFDYESAKIVFLPSEPTSIPVTVATLTRAQPESIGLENVGTKRVERARFVEVGVNPPFPLETFPIQIAKVEQHNAEWVVEYEKSEAQRYVEVLPESVLLDLVLVPAGVFMMGSPANEPERFGREGPQHEVTIAYSFLMGRYPVTQLQWRTIASLPSVNLDLEPNPSRFSGDNHPVEGITWYEAVEFCDRLNAYYAQQSSKPKRFQYRLPSEAEWEYACRAKTTTPFSFGQMITTNVARYNGKPYAEGPVAARQAETASVYRFRHANAFGLSDMHGNVREWCLDHWHPNYNQAPTDGSAWLSDAPDSNRVRRGGSWNGNPGDCRSACRYPYKPGNYKDNLGFRVVLAPHLTSSSH